MKEQPAARPSAELIHAADLERERLVELAIEARPQSRFFHLGIILVNLVLLAYAGELAFSFRHDLHLAPMAFVVGAICLMLLTLLQIRWSVRRTNQLQKLLDKQLRSSTYLTGEDIEYVAALSGTSVTPGYY